MATLTTALRPRRLARRSRDLWRVVVAGGAVLALAACGSASGSGSSSGAAPAASSAASSGSAAVDQASVDAATKAVATYVDPAAAYTGPTTGSPAPKGKSIVFIPCAATLALCVDAGKSVEKAATSLGWKVTTIDGAGTASGWLDAMNKAIALKPDAIIEAAISPEAVPAGFKSAKAAGIPVVSLFAAGFPGPIESAPVFYNEDTNGEAIGTAMAQYAIADSGGTARVVIVYDNAYAIARAKNDAMLKTIKACTSCTVLEDTSTPFGELSKNVPGLTAGWLGKYGSEPFYVLAVGDVLFSNMVPTLTSRNVDPAKVKLVGADGTADAYQRIREGKYQVATVPQPTGEMAYNAVDQVVRALNGEQPFDWSPVPYLVVKDNIDKAGGSDNKYDPQNDYAAKYAALWGTA